MVTQQTHLFAGTIGKNIRVVQPDPSDAGIVAAMARKSLITMLIAHRLPTMMDADTIVVLEQGRIVEQASHAQLPALRGLYYAMWRAQAGGRPRLVAAARSP